MLATDPHDDHGRRNLCAGRLWSGQRFASLREV